MALPDRTYNVQVRDSESHIYTAQFFGDSLDAGATAIFTAQLENRIGALTLGVIADVSYTVRAYSSGAIPTGNVDGEMKATFTFNDVDGKAVTVSIPAFDRAKLLPNSKSVDMDDADVQAFITMVVNQLKTSRNLDIVAVRSAVESYSRRTGSTA